MSIIAEVMSNSRIAFLNQQNELALELAKQAIKLDSSEADAYKCAANALMSLERYEEAIKNYSLAVKYDASNGNRYYDLGFAQATNDRLADALKNLAKADSLGCIPENTMQLYNLLGLICFDIGRYDDALTNLSKAEQLAGVNLDILQRKAIIYGLKKEIRNGLQVANEIKLVAPSEYIGYQLAFKLLTQAKRLDAAWKELEKAAKFVSRHTMDLYFDKMTLELELYKEDKDKTHFYNALWIVQMALQNVQPDVSGVVESYINAAELYLQLEEPEKTLECLNAAEAPVSAFNNGFAVWQEEQIPPAPLDDYTMEAMMEEDQMQMDADPNAYDLEALVEGTVPNEFGEREFFTELDEAAEEITAVYKLDPAEAHEISQENQDQITRLYIGAYTLLKDYEKVISYARTLQAGEEPQNVYIGKYTEANAYKEMGSAEASKKYEDAIRFFRNAMIKDPTDLAAVTFRIQCYIDMEMYSDAEEVCKLLAEESRAPFMEKIEKAKAGGE